MLQEETQNKSIDVDPVDWLHQHREEVLRKYPTFEARREYYKQFHSVDEVLKRIQKKLADKKQGE